MRSSNPDRGDFAVHVIGRGLLALGGMTAILAVVAGVMGDPWRGFATAAFVAFGLGAFTMRTRRPDGEPTRREALLTVLGLWFAVPLVGAIPFLVDGNMPFFDAWFEAMSGFTATGATAVTDFGALSSTLFFWRAFAQWIGGIGIIALFVAVFPQLAIAGRQLFAAEVPSPSDERFTPRLRESARALLWTYLVMTLIATAAYSLAGLQLGSAVLHALTTVSAAGFSPEARSFAGFPAAAQWVAIVFMTLAGANFLLQMRLLTGRPQAMWRDAEFRTYVTIFLTASLGLTAYLVPTYGEAALRHGLFQAISILTTTGYASVDFGAWDSAPQTILILLMFIGGSAGSASGGVKVVRLMIVAKNTAREVQRVLHPRAVLPVRVAGAPVPEVVLRGAAAFVTLYALTFAGLTLALALMGVDFTTAFTASIATLGNIGPGLGAVGPMESFAGLPTAAKPLLTLAMYAGRLEVMAVFVLLTPDAWSLPRGWLGAWRRGRGRR